MRPGRAIAPPSNTVLSCAVPHSPPAAGSVEERHRVAQSERGVGSQWIGVASSGLRSLSASAARRGSRWPRVAVGNYPQMGARATPRAQAISAVLAKRPVSPAK